MTEAELIRRAWLNAVETWRTFARASTDGSIHEEDGIVMVATGVPASYFNPTFVLHPPRNPDVAFQRLRAFYDQLALPAIAYSLPDDARLVDPHARAVGFTPDSPEVGMLLRWEDAIGPVPVVGLEIRRITNVEGLRRFYDTGALAFEAPRDTLGPIDDPLILDQPDLTFYLGYLDGEPVATAQSFVSHRIAAVHTIGVVPSYRRRGIGAVMSWHMLDVGRAAGCLAACLTASSMGFPIYQRMGFRNLVSYPSWVLERD